MIRIVRILSSIALCALPMLCAAQAGTGNQSGDFDQTQVITGDRELSLQKAFKISDRPAPLDIPVAMGDLKYELIPRRPAIAIVLDPIVPAKVKVREPLDKLYHGYVKAGGGTFATPFIEAMYTSTRNRDLAYGVRLKHMSANDGVNRPVGFSGFSQNEADLWAKKIFGKHAIEGKLYYDRDVNYFYGFDPQDQDIDKKQYRQRFNTIGLDSQWKSYYRDSSRVNHTIDLDVYNRADRYDANEFGINAQALLSAFRADRHFTLGTGLDLIAYKADSLKAFEFLNDTSGFAIPETDQANAIFHLTPKILIAKNGLQASVGLAIYGQFSNQARFHVFPDLYASYSLFDNLFTPYAGITGKVNRTGFRTLTDQNPFILSNSNLQNEILKYDLFGGVRGSISKFFSFNLRAGYKRADNTALFVNDTLVSAENRFSVIYDDVKTFTLSGELTYKRYEKWSLTATGEVFNYTADVEDEAWHLPSFRFGMAADYNLYDKFIAKMRLSWIGSRQVKSLLPVDGIDATPNGYFKVELDPYLDLALSLEYRYTARLSAFVEASNLTASGYDIYYRFPAQRVFLMGGFKFAF